jgi:hypothetical protein
MKIFYDSHDTRHHNIVYSIFYQQLYRHGLLADFSDVNDIKVTSLGHCSLMSQTVTVATRSKA